MSNYQAQEACNIPQETHRTLLHSTRQDFPSRFLFLYFEGGLSRLSKLLRPWHCHWYGEQSMFSKQDPVELLSLFRPKNQLQAIQLL
jgi:hypothetical protein